MIRRVLAAGLFWLLTALWFLPAPAHAAGPVTTVVAVRHAEKASEQGRDPHLTLRGQARARDLATLVAGEVPVAEGLVTGLYSSEFHRTRETLAPLAQRLGLEIQTIPARETNQRLTAEWLVAHHPDEVIVVAGHSNTIPSLVEALTGSPTPELDETVYDALFVISVHADGTAHALRLSYGGLAATATEN